jgi:hypothetical protein
MATFQFFNAFKADVHNGVHNLGSDTIKAVYSDVAPSAANAVLADITEIATGNGYSAGGVTVAISSSAQTGGTYSLVNASAAVTASGGPVGPFRYIVFYNDTAANDELIGWLDYGVSYTLPDGQPFTIPAGTLFTNA